MRRFSLADPAALPDAGVLRAAELRALSDASEIIRSAQAKAAAREAEQAKRLEAALVEATERAYADGLRDLAAAAAAYGAATDALSTKLTDLLRQCLIRVFRARPAKKVLLATVAPVLSKLTGAREIAVAVHPSRAEALEAALAEAQTALSGIEIAVETDPALDPEDCRIFTESDVINVGAPVVIERLIGALSDHLAAAEKATEEGRESDPKEMSDG